jgi:hypothetical protein
MDTIDVSQLQQSCEDQATTMIFCYFFGWSLAFWSVGHPQLMQAANMKTDTSASAVAVAAMNTNTNTTTTSPDRDTDTDTEHYQNENDTAITADDERDSNKDHVFSFAKALCNALKQTVTSTGSIAMVAGFLTACVPPLQDAVFDAGGALRFLGAALESLGQASSPISTMVVAASMVPIPVVTPEPAADAAAVRVRREEIEMTSSGNEWNKTPQHTNALEDQDREQSDENPIMSDPNFGPHQPRQQPPNDEQQKQPYRRRLCRAVTRRSIRILQAATRSTPEMRRLHVWFVLSRLVLSPAFVVGAIVGLDCGTNVLSSVPPLAKLVVIVNASLPGALVVVVLLKSNPDLAETAAAVAKGKCSRCIHYIYRYINLVAPSPSVNHLTRRPYPLSNSYPILSCRSVFAELSLVDSHDFGLDGGRIMDYRSGRERPVLL